MIEKLRNSWYGPITLFNMIIQSNATKISMLTTKC